MLLLTASCSVLIIIQTLIDLFIPACDCRGYCVFPSFLWRHQQHPHSADETRTSSDGNSGERRWIERVVLGNMASVDDEQSTFSGGSGPEGRAATSSAPFWETQRDVMARQTELVVEQKTRTLCGGGGAPPGGTAGGRVSCYRRDSTWSIICLAEEPMGKYRILETDKTGKLTKIGFATTNRYNVMFGFGQIRGDERLEDRTGDGEFKKRKHAFVVAAATDFQWATCSVQGGFDFTATTADSDKKLCPDAWRPSRLESECIHGDGLTFYFPNSDCNPLRTAVDAPDTTIDRYQCLASWQEDVFRFVIFGTAARSHHRYVLRMPADIDSLDEFTAHLYLGPIVPLNNTPKSSELHVVSYQLRLLRSEPGVCFDESASCQQFAREGRCTSSAVHQYANYCKHSCGLCEFAPSAKAECKFASELTGSWVMYSGYDREEAAIEDGEVRFSTLGRFTCKSKHWEEDFYKVFSVFTNGCRPRYSCLRLSRGDGNTLLFSMSASDLTDRSFDLCEFPDDSISSTNQLRSWRAKVLVPMSNLLHAGCGISDHLRADIEFANGLTCYGGFVSDVSYRQHRRCEPISSLTVGLPSKCKPSRHEPHHRHFPGPVTLEYRCVAVVRLSEMASFLVSQKLTTNSSAYHSDNSQYTCWTGVALVDDVFPRTSRLPGNSWLLAFDEKASKLLRDMVDERRRLVTELSRARCDTAHAIILPRTSSELVALKLYRDFSDESLCPTSTNIGSALNVDPAGGSKSTLVPSQRHPTAAPSRTASTFSVVYRPQSSGTTDVSDRQRHVAPTSSSPLPSVHKSMYGHQSDTTYRKIDDEDGGSSADFISGSWSSSQLVPVVVPAPNSRIRKQPEQSAPFVVSATTTRRPAAIVDRAAYPGAINMATSGLTGTDRRRSFVQRNYLTSALASLTFICLYNDIDRCCGRIAL